MLLAEILARDASSITVNAYDTEPQSSPDLDEAGSVRITR